MPIINTNYGGSDIPTLTNPATVDDVSNGKEYIDGNGAKQTGTFVNYEDAIVSGVFQNEEYVNNRITQIGVYKFRAITTLISITMNNVKGISTNAFYGCSKLKNVIMPNVNYVDNAVFYGCVSLENYPFSNNDSLTILNSQVFSGCIALTKVKLQKRVAAIHQHAFQNCSNVLLYDFRDRELNNIPTTGGSWQGMNANCKIVVPDNLYDAWIIASNWVSMASHIVKASDYID